MQLRIAGDILRAGRPMVLLESNPVARRLHTFAGHLRRTWLHPGVEEIHDLRISIRRLRQALKLCRRPLPGRFRRKLKRLMQLAGRIRDCDIALGHFTESGHQDLESKARRKRTQLETKLMRFLDNNGQFLLSSRGPGLQVTKRSATRRIHSLARRFFRLGAKAAGPSSSLDRLHRTRIAAKQLRYTLELFSAGDGADPTDLLPSLARLQRLLGEINDLRTILTSLSRRANGDKASRALREKQQRKILRFSRIWERDFATGEESFSNRLQAAIAEAGWAL